ncbi:MAG: hypothetical protein ACUVRZ_06335 [Desulfobacca sp.]
MHTRGSHHKFRHPDGRTVTVPFGLPSAGGQKIL